MVKRNITLDDIAKVLGVSKATVSLAIKNDPRVALKTRQRVKNTAKDLGYIYNRGAAGLVTGKTNTIGIAVHDLPNPFFAEVCTAIETVLGENDILSFLCNTNESIERQKKFIEGLIEHRADGLILCPATNTDFQSLRILFDVRLPTVLIARELEGIPLDFIGNDGRKAVELATEHLINLGHTRIAMIGGGYQASSALRRRSGYQYSLASNDIPLDPELIIDCETSARGGEEGIQKVLRLPAPPTAAVCLTDLVALGVISGLHNLNIIPGKEFAVIGCDDIEEASRGYMRLTTVRMRKSEVGQQAAEILIQRITDPDLPIRRNLYEPELIIRDSCGSRYK